jgi:ketosteroid isomerase-like protein
VSTSESGGTRESERLARRYFTLYARGETERLLELVHPDAEIVLKSAGGEVLRGRDAVARFLDETAGRFHETHPDVYRALDDERVIVEGRMRWMDEERVLRDDPVVFALEFRGGLLYRSLPATSVLEAQALLSGGRQGATQD